MIKPFRIPPNVQVLGFLFCLALMGCESEKEQDSFAPIIDLAGIPISAQLAPQIEAAWQFIADKEKAEGEAVVQLQAYEELKPFFDHPETAPAAADTAFSLWAREPSCLLWLDLARFDSRRLDRGTNYTAMMARPDWADTNTILGLYAMGLNQKKHRASLAIMRRVHERQDEFSPLSRVWAATKLSWRENGWGSPDRAIQVLVEALPEARSCGGPILECQVWLRMRHALIATKRFDDAQHVTVVTEALARQAGLEYRQLICTVAVADLLGRRGEYEAAIALFYQCIEQAKSQQLSKIESKVCALLSENLGAVGRHGEAVVCRSKTLEYLRAINDPINTPRSMISLASHYRMLGDIQAWHAWQDSARAFIDQYPYPPNVEALPIYLLPYYFQIGAYDVADSLLTVMQQRTYKGQSGAILADLYLGQLRLSIESGRPAQAYAAIEAIDQIGDRFVEMTVGRSLQADCQIMAADFHALQGEFVRAQAALDRADDILEEEGGGGEYQRWLWEWSQGKLAFLAGDLTSARSHFEAGLIQAEKVSDPDRKAEIRMNLARFYLATNRLDDAHSFFVADDADSTYGGNSRVRLASRIGLAEVEARRGNLEKALKWCSVASLLAVRHAPSDLKMRLELQRGQIQIGLDHPAEAEKSFLTALDILAESTSSPSGEERIFAGDQEHDLREALIGLYFDHPEFLPDQNPALHTLLLRESEKQISTADLARWLREYSGLLLACFVGEERSFLWIIDNGNIEVIQRSGREELAGYAKSMQASVSQHTGQVNEEASRHLGAWLFSLLEDRWNEGEVLTIVPDRELRALPWSALAMPDFGGPLVVDHAPVIEVPSLYFVTDLTTLASTKPGMGSMLALGMDGPAEQDDAAKRLPELRYAEQEAREVASLWPAGRAFLRTGNKADFDSLEPQLLADCQVIHLATHMVVNRGVTGQSTLHLATRDETAPLTVDRVAEQDFPVDLVYLSCCEAAGAQSSGGINDFAGAFLTAGAGSVVASPLKVNDEAARYLATAFYRHWLDGKGRAAALWAARREVRSESRWMHPFFWASFRILGRGD